MQAQYLPTGFQRILGINGFVLQVFQDIAGLLADYKSAVRCCGHDIALHNSLRHCHVQPCILNGIRIEVFVIIQCSGTSLQRAFYGIRNPVCRSFIVTVLVLAAQQIIIGAGTAGARCVCAGDSILITFFVMWQIFCQVRIRFFIFRTLTGKSIWFAITI